MLKSLVVCFALFLLLPLSGFGDTIVLRSGNGTIGTLDSQIHMLVGPADTYFSSLLTSTDFENARNGASAPIIGNHSAWIAGLSGDSQSKWISTNFSGATEGGTALFAIDFILPAFVSSAAVVLHYATDNLLGGNGNQGVFFNGVAVSGDSTGGSFGSEFTMTRTDIAPLLRSGLNTFYILSTDVGGPGALLFRAEITYTPAPEPWNLTMIAISLFLGWSWKSLRRKKIQA